MSFLPDRFVGFGDKPALAGPWGVTDYAGMHAIFLRVRAELAGLSLPPASMVGLIGGHGPAAVAWLLALEEHGHFVAPLAGDGSERPRKLAQIRAQWVITTDGPDWKILPRVDELMAHPLLEDLRSRGRSGLVLFSSGTSGQPKVMVQDFTALLATYESRRPSRLPVLALLGFDHIGGLNTLFGALASGALLVAPADRSPASVVRAMERHRVAVLPASPTFLNLLLASGAAQGADLACLRVITYGTEPMPESLLGRLKAAFPLARFIQTFGTSETGIARTESPDPDSTFIRFEDPHLEWKVVDDELWLRSRTQIAGYLNESNERFTADGWFRTGDKVELGPSGTLRVLGRMGEMINVGGEKLMPVEVEAVILTVPGVIDCRVFGEKHALTGQAVAAEVVSATGADRESLRAEIRSACRRALARHKVPTRVGFVAAVSGERMKKQR